MNEKPKIGDAQSGDAAELASVSARFAAFFIDGIIVGVIAIVALLLIGLVFGDSAEFLMQFVALVLYVGFHKYFLTRRDGQTPGKSMLGIQVVKADGTSISNVDAVIRAIGYQVSSIFFALGFIWAIFDTNNQSWHDKIARTYVVRKHKERHTVQV